MKTDADLQYTTWVLVGNALQHTLRGAKAFQLAESPQRDRLEQMDAGLRDVPPEGMLMALRALPWSDRNLLADLCSALLDRAGESAASLLGTDRAEAAPVLELLRNRL